MVKIRLNEQDFRGPYRVGKTKKIFYDVVEGAYYDPVRDWYLTEHEYKVMKEDGFDEKDYEYLGSTEYETYLAKDIDNNYFILRYYNTPGSNPRALLQNLRDRAQELGFGEPNVVAHWPGEMDHAHERAMQQLNSNRNWIAQYRDRLQQIVRDVEKAKKIMRTENVVTENHKKSNRRNRVKENEIPDDGMNTPYWEGQRAYGTWDDMNPYPEGSEAAFEWQMGYDHASQEDEMFNESKKVGDRVKYRNIKSKREKTGTIKNIDTKNGQKRYELENGKMVYHSDLIERSDYKTNTVVVNMNGQKKEIQIPQNARVHHIAQALKKSGIRLGDIELTTAARDLSQGKTYRQGSVEMKVQARRPRQMENIQENTHRYQKDDRVIALEGPHKGQEHVVMKVFDDGSVNIRPLTTRVRYRLGAVRASPDQIKPAE